MKKSRVFEIAYVGLREGAHTYEYQIDQKFLVDMGYEGNDINNLECTVKLIFDKKVNFFQLHFDIDGKANVACDRCGDPLELILWDEYKLIVKLTNNEDLADSIEEDVVFIPFNETIIDVSEWIYEFILLSLPMQRIHKEDEKGNSLCNPEMIKILDEHKLSLEEQERKNIWKGLENLKNKN